MQNMIKEIVDMDRRAREITEAAQQEKSTPRRRSTESAKQIREEYLTKARERIALNEPKEREAAEEAWRAVEARQNEISAKLDAQYAEHGDHWAAELAKRVLERKKRPAPPGKAVICDASNLFFQCNSR